MELQKVKILLQKYFEGNTTLEEEQILESYFQSEDIDAELVKYRELFTGISELSQPLSAEDIGEDIMDHILEQEHHEKKRYRWMWQTISGVAASILIVLGGLLIYEQNRKPFEDTFEDPEVAYAYAEHTLKYISSKYRSGVLHLASAKTFNASLQPLSKIKKINNASKPLNSSVKTINKGFNELKKLKEIRNKN